ncbi:MAG: DUF456 domain-containing protein [Deltaproteobacteria bacterium]|nr:DUF456 domain-containing protein [Deltaproteobacteria bacterium]
MTPLEIGGLTLFILTLLFGAFSILFGLPGTIIILSDAFLYAALTGFERIGFKVLLTLLVLTVLAEIVDFAVGMSVALKFGLSRSAFLSFLLGGSVGAFVLTPFLLGLGLIVGAFLGGLAGMLVAELLQRNALKPNLREAWGVILGRTAGICVKGFFSLIMVIITLTSAYS